MGHGGIGDQRDIGPGRGHAEGNFSHAIGAHFDDSEAVPGINPQQGQGYADGVVQIAAGRKAASFQGQNGIKHFLDRGLALTAGNREHPGRGTLTIGARDLRQRQAGIGHAQLRQILRGQPADHGARGAAAPRLGQKLIAIEIFACQRKKQLALAQTAGIGRDRVKAGIAAGQFAIQFRCQRIKIHIAYQDPCPAASAARRRSACLTTPASLNSRRSAPIC